MRGERAEREEKARPRLRRRARAAAGQGGWALGDGLAAWRGGKAGRGTWREGGLPGGAHGALYARALREREKTDLSPPPFVAWASPRAAQPPPSALLLSPSHAHSDVHKPAGSVPPAPVAATATVTVTGSPLSKAAAGDDQPHSPPKGNNYSRPGGQNVGNFLTDRPSSRVLAPPGGGSQIHFG